MDKILCIVGESGSGKTTVAEALEKEGYNYIQSFTTRKPRYDGEKGHVFATLSEYKEDLALKNIIASTFFDENYYWASKWQYQNKGTSIYVVDTNGARDLKINIKDAEIIVIYLKTDEEVRRVRMIRRYRDSHITENSNLSEKQFINGEAYNIARKRLEHDREAFKLIECNYVVNANRWLTEVIEDIKGIIERN